MTLLRNGTWSWTAPLELLGVEAEEEELLGEEDVGVAPEVELELELEDPTNVRCKNKGKCRPARVYVPHSACCSASADAWSAAVQFAVRQAATVDWKTVLVHEQLMLVLEKEDRVREGGPEAVDDWGVEREEYVLRGASGGRLGLR